MKFLNVKMLGLTGKPHPALLNIFSTQQAKKLRLHLKFLSGDFLTCERRAKDQPILNPICKLCFEHNESYEHLLVQCRATAEIRQRLYPELLNTVLRVQPTSSMLLYQITPHQLTQFILDCTSINLAEDIRIPAHNPNISEIFRISRDWCFAVSNERTRILKTNKTII